jgi:hypothetical protein
MVLANEWLGRRSAPITAAAALLVTVLLLAGCQPGAGKPKEYAYVAAPQAMLRDRVAAVFNKVGVVKNGERVEVLEKSRRFVRVRTAANEMGWVEQRYLVTQEVYDGFQKLAAEHGADAVQAHATARTDVNLHLVPDRESEHFHQVKETSKVDLLRRASSPKPASIAPTSKASKDQAKPAPVLEDWWLVRDGQGHVGWLLARLVDEDVPLDIAQYAEGQRIVAYFVLNQVEDEGKPVAQYLVALTEPRDGLPFDYNQIRVFTRNTHRHRYETAYRERKLAGVLPISIGKQEFEKEGVLPTFTLRVKNDTGAEQSMTYKLNGPMVRRVLAPGEQPKVTSHGPARTARPRRRRH